MADKGDVTSNPHTREEGLLEIRRAAAGAALCRVCGGDAFFALTASDRTQRDGRCFDYVECTVCGSLQIESLPDDLERTYGDDYYTGRGHLRRVPVGRAPGLRRRLARLRLGLRPACLARAISGRRYGRFDWLRRTGTGQGDAILDVGCGSGRLLFRLHADGFRNLVGIDPNLPPNATVRAAGRRGLRFDCSTPLTHPGVYRLVMAHHSFEHMQDPVAAFAAMASRVAPGGFLLLRVPLADSWARRHYGADWAQLDAPRHLQIPTRRSIEFLAAGAGLELLHVEDDSGVFQIWGSERDLPHSPIPRLVRWLSARRQAARLRRAGQGDQAAFYLRRLT